MVREKIQNFPNLLKINFRKYSDTLRSVYIFFHSFNLNGHVIPYRFGGSDGLYAWDKHQSDAATSDKKGNQNVPILKFFLTFLLKIKNEYIFPECS